jgi:hypothetical protein
LKNEQGNELFDINEEPFKSAQSKPWKPQKSHYKKEIQRRYENQDNSDVLKKAPGCAKWTSAVLVQYLIENPVRDETEVSTI